MAEIDGSGTSDDGNVGAPTLPSETKPTIGYKPDKPHSPLQKISEHEKDLDLREIALREELFSKIVPYFVKANVSVLTGIVILVIAETILVSLDSNYVRIANDKVLICLLTATTVQLGTIALRIGRSLFK